MFSDFPNLHPLVVHLPIVLLLLSAALQALLVFKDWSPVRWITIGVMAGGFLGALAASTVFHALPMGLAPQAAAVFEAHEKFAGYTLWLSGITLLLAIVGTFFKIQRRAYEILVLVSAVATAGVLSVAGHRGAQLVYVEGVGPQGRLLDKSHGHGGEEAMPAMEMGTDRYDEAEGADGHSGGNVPASPSPNATAVAPGSTDMPGMDMSGPASAKKGSRVSPGTMGNMDMPGDKTAGQDRPASANSAMQDMPGMNRRTSKSAPSMPAGMDMSRPSKQKPLNEMAGMQNMPGMSRQTSGAKKPVKTQSATEAMDTMADMPGMKAPSPKQPNQSMPAMSNMPGMEKGQAMPTNPMDKYRFEDNNPARRNLRNAKQ